MKITFPDNMPVDDLRVALAAIGYRMEILSSGILVHKGPPQIQPPLEPCSKCGQTLPILTIDENGRYCSKCSLENMKNA